MSIGNELFKNVVRSILVLYEFKKQGIEPTVSEFLKESGINHSVFHNHLKRNLQKAGWVEIRVNRDRTVTLRLTEQGERVAKAFDSIRDLLRNAGAI